VGLSALKSLFTLLLILIPIAAIIIFINMGSNQIPKLCSVDVDSSKDVVLSNLMDCADICWRNHGLGEDLSSDDCFLVKMTSDQDVTREDLEGIHEKAKVYFNFSLVKDKTYRVTLRYNASDGEISVLNYGFCGNDFVEQGEICDGSISSCNLTDFEFGGCSDKRFCSDSCFCEATMNCGVCSGLMPNPLNPNTDNDWCKYCKSPREITCDDGYDNDCDGETDQNDTDCGGGSSSTTTAPTAPTAPACKKKIADYARKYAKKVVGDGCFFTGPSDVDCSLGSGTKAPDNFADGSDCAHFVSYSLHEGGIDTPCRYSPATCEPYGEPGANNLKNILINQKGAKEVKNIYQLEEGDVVFYDWNSDGWMDHTTVYLGNQEVASHTSNGIFDWRMESSVGSFYFVKVKC
jgi:cell wall-associated NlpC family hydrolase